MIRILGIELRRSAALGAALMLLVLGATLLYFSEEVQWSDSWMQLAMAQRLYLALLWPLALAAGAWQGRREHRSNVGELFATTPRPRASRTAPTLGAMAVAVVAGYLVMGLVAAVRIVGTLEYLPLAVFAVTAVGALALIAAVWVGLAVGRLLPYLVTGPALAVAGLALLLLLPLATRPRGWLALVFSPIYEMNMPGAFATVPGRASLSQAIWLAALAGTAVLLFASSGWRARVAAVLPVAVGAALAISVMPQDSRYVFDATDAAARELVCAEGAPRVCVSRVHSGLLSAVTTPARQGLATLAKLPGAPTDVHEDTSTFGADEDSQWRPDVVQFRIETGPNGHLKQADDVALAVLAGAFTGSVTCDLGPSFTDRIAATYWLLGRKPVLSTTYADPDAITEAVTLWEKLTSMPAAEVTPRVAAVREAAVNCREAEGLLSRSAG